jgi:hypothetical protein
VENIISATGLAGEPAARRLSERIRRGEVLDRGGHGAEIVALAVRLSQEAPPVPRSGKVDVHNLGWRRLQVEHPHRDAAHSDAEKANRIAAPNDTTGYAAVSARTTTSRVADGRDNNVETRRGSRTAVPRGEDAEAWTAATCRNSTAPSGRGHAGSSASPRAFARRRSAYTA